MQAFGKVRPKSGAYYTRELLFFPSTEMKSQPAFPHRNGYYMQDFMVCCMTGYIGTADCELCSSLGCRVAAGHRQPSTHVDSCWRRRRQPRLGVHVWWRCRSTEWSFIATHRQPQRHHRCGKKSHLIASMVFVGIFLVDILSVLHTIEDFSVFQRLWDIIIAPLWQFQL